jgi:hypothetical protein
VLDVGVDTVRIFLSRSPRALAVYGAVTGLSALAALFLGVMLGSEH